MSQGDSADSARTSSSSSSNSNNTDATISPLPGNRNQNITTNLLHQNDSNTQHIPYVAVVPSVSTTLKISAMQPRSAYKSDDSGPKYFDPYDPWIGIRTAAILGSFLMLIVVYILYKARCRLSGSIEVNKVSYYQEYKDRCRERILMNIRARNNMANANDRTPNGGEGVATLDFTAKWIQSQPLYSAIPDESGEEVKMPTLNWMQNHLHLSDIQLQSSLPKDLHSPGGRERNKALLQLLQESNQDHFPIDHRNFAALGELPICYGKVSNTDAANSSDLTHLSGQSPPMSNTHYHKPLIHHTGLKDSDQSIVENLNLPSTKLNAGSVQIEMVPLSHRVSINEERDSDSLNSTKVTTNDTSREQRTSSHRTPLTSESKMRSQSHSSLIPSASSMSSGLELMDPLRLITANGGPKMHRKSRSNGNIVQMKVDSRHSLWKPLNDAVTKL